MNKSIKRGRLVSLAAIALGTWLGAITAQERALLPGDPLPGISAVEFSEFRLGLEDFTEVETSEDGLGPAFNGTSCAVCHNLPAIGGGNVMLETRAAIETVPGRGLVATHPNGGGDVAGGPVCQCNTRTGTSTEVV